MAAASERLRRSQVSWTASSALDRRTQHAIGDRAQVGPVRLELFGQNVLVGHRHISSPGSDNSVSTEVRPM
jgi:hypothetical protein